MRGVVMGLVGRWRMIRIVIGMWMRRLRHVSGMLCVANDPKIFLSWIGTDRSGDYMLSQALRISRFTEYAVGNAYADAVKIFK